METFLNKSEIMYPTVMYSEHNYYINSKLDNYTFCSREYERFVEDNFPIDVVNSTCLAICVFGAAANLLNLVVFSRKKMANPINVLLMGISMVDLIPMLMFIVLFVSSKIGGVYYGALGLMSMMISLSLFHPVSVWITLTLAIFRYIAVIYPLKSAAFCTMRRAKVVMSFLFVVNLLFCAPPYMCVSILGRDPTKSWQEGGCGLSYCVECNQLHFIRRIEFFYRGLLTKLVASLGMAFISISLIMALVRASKIRRRMSGFVVTSYAPSDKATSDVCTIMDHNLGQSHGHAQKRRQSCINQMNEFDRTTKMLIVVLLLFLATEFPPGVVYVTMAFLGRTFYYECWRPIYRLLLVMYFLSGTLNFFVYISMSAKYRTCLANIFHLKEGKRMVSSFFEIFDFTFRRRPL